MFSADVQVLNYPADRGGEGDVLDAGGEVFAGGTNVTATRMPPP